MQLPLIRIYEREDLVETKQLPYAKFPFPKFNPVQSGLFDVYDKDANFIVASSTSSGKTACFEMIASHEVRVKGNKVIYLSPLKSLSQEKLDDWMGEHHFADLKISICTGDYRLTASRIKELNEADIIIATSETLNSLSRNHKSEKNQFLSQIGLVCADESHGLSDLSRGSHIESGIMKFTEINKNARILMLSATLPNVDEIGRWLHSLNGRSTYLLESKWRPCKLNIHYEQYSDDAWGYEENERKKVYLTCQIIKKYSQDKFICFVHTKKTGEMLIDFLITAGIQCDYHNANLEKEKRIKIEKQFREDPKLRVIVATSGLSSGVNMPARRVIVVGVHRALQEVETKEIIQECGRAGRPQYDTEGDAYILIPKRKFKEHVERLEKPTYIQSQMMNPKILAFHLVSEIHHGTIRTLDDIYKWYSRTLAHFQNKKLDDDVIDQVIESLTFSGCIREEEGNLSTTASGTIASMFYYNPFDVADLAKNFNTLFKNDKADNENWLAMALGNLDSNRIGIANNAEREEMEEFTKNVVGSKIEKTLSPRQPFTLGALKAGYCYLQLLSGANSKNLNNIMRTIQMDFGRTSEVLNAIDTMAGKWGQNQFFKELGLRIAYGVPVELIELCSLKGIGRAKAQKLYSAGLKQLKDINDVTNVIKALGCSKRVAEELVNQAKNII